jgi:hypothetical protein
MPDLKYKRPSKERQAIMTGALPLSDASPAVRSWFRHTLYTLAVSIIERRAYDEIETHPETYMEQLRLSVSHLKHPRR